MTLARMADLVQQIGRALSAAHSAGVCHRDLKPSNIIVQRHADGEEQVKLIDFGLATVEHLDAASTSTRISGTWAYMAPEQFHGKYSPASDIYQFGVVTYELATGVQPFPASAPADMLWSNKKETCQSAATGLAPGPAGGRSGRDSQGAFARSQGSLSTGSGIRRRTRPRAAERLRLGRTDQHRDVPTKERTTGRPYVPAAVGSGRGGR